jgi:hypothetical protein
MSLKGYIFGSTQKKAQEAVKTMQQVQSKMAESSGITKLIIVGKA